MSERPDGLHSLSLGAEVQQELVKLHARMMIGMPWVHAPLIVLLAIACVPSVPSALFAGWGAAMMGIELIRSACGAFLLRRTLTLSARKAHAIQSGLAAVSGLILGAAAPLFLPRLAIVDQAWLICVLVAVPALGVAVSMASRYIAGLYACGVLAPATLGWVTQHPELAMSASFGSLSYIGVLVFSAGENQRSLTSSVAIRRQRDDMVQDLKRSNAVVQEAVARAEQESAARAHVLAAASHDLRQPLHALSVYSAVLAANPSQVTLREVSTHIDQLVRSLGELLHGLLDLSRMTSGHYVPHTQCFDLSAVLESVACEFDSVAAAKGISLRRTLSPVTLSGDLMAVSRITRNLLDNAIKYTAAGVVHLSLRRTERTATISVADTGKGIAPADQSRIFDEFYQVENSARDRRQGVGLGLAIVKRLAQLIHATLTLESVPGVGSRFELAIPGVVEPPGADTLPPLTLRPSVEGSRRVLVVDDDEEIRRSTASLLTLWNCSVETAAGSAETWALCELTGPPDLLIVDLRLGGPESGSQLAGRLLQRYGAFAVLVITGETSSAALEATRAAGWPILQKPVDVALLRKAIDQTPPRASTAPA
ncbi:MAG: hybrid sensor histidine kinase/response regulator [Variovorax sp.]|nr:MAG: hybrid sensor histidine kinase/response regulator [Variovorax sp.]